MSTERPRAVERLDVSEAKDGLIVYDPVTDRVHHLNATAAVVFTLCDGEADLTSIAQLVAETFGLERPPLDEVRDCVRSLLGEGIVA